MWAKPWAWISTNSLRSEVQSQRMKRKINISVHVSQDLGSDINKQLEVSTSITKNEKKKQNFYSCEPSHGLRYQQTAWAFKFNHKEWKNKSKLQLMWAKPWAQISTNRLRFEVQSQRIKEKINISIHVSQALSFDLNK
jgi:hypothetical protein